MTVLRQSLPLALYVHFPWCLRKCPYCDFTSYEVQESFPERVYIDALLADLEHDVPISGGRYIESIFIGGGTPSLLSAEAVDRLLSGIRAQLPLRPNLEVTLEANPGTVERERLSEFRAVGINRLSIGVQSFNDDHLQRIGRLHDRRAAFAAAEAAHAAGLDRFNLDLMFGLPGQSIAQALADVANAIDLQPAHVSYYQLTIEPNTPFHAEPPNLPDEELIDRIQNQAQVLLAERGYPRYEVSAYADPSQRCRHNLNYWEFGDYLGIGAGAHSKLTDGTTGTISRRWKCQDPQNYLKRAGTSACIDGETPIAETNLPVEFLMNALRLVEGVPATLFTERTGLALTVLEPAATQLRERGWLVPQTDRLQATATGLRFLNDLLQEFL